MQATSEQQISGNPPQLYNLTFIRSQIIQFDCEKQKRRIVTEIGSSSSAKRPHDASESIRFSRDDQQILLHVLRRVSSAQLIALVRRPSDRSKQVRDVFRLP